ncbi:Ca-activated chloride channel family protein [Stackebrandtia albiflava]|uniref:Ca-activated chloride channel family protein n=1 Tax=Stackebrandtia albiflava TaxID=406432 RepID=A0A562VAU7_9ACTN|nr:hypothetical protein [Stackebrandtia albiflava]TWJ15002.1 Ca-activated chloride channel family protein [Stackebrandtia albiflava]
MIPSAWRRTAGTALAVVAAAACVAGVSGTARAESEVPGRVVVAVDNSAAMTETAGATGSAWDAVTTAVAGAVEDAPRSAELALRAMGSGTGCDTGDVVRPMSPVEPGAGELDAVAVGGGRPVSDTLRLAAEAATGSTTVLLLTGGGDDCGGDPVDTAAAVAAASPGVRVDVVAFRADASDRATLMRLAAAGGGRFHDAPDAESLGAVLHRAVGQAWSRWDTGRLPVSGSVDGLDPPTLPPGRYVDVLPADETGLHYAFTLPEGATAHVAASVGLRAPHGASASNGVGVVVRNESATACARHTDRRETPGGGALPATAAVSVAWSADAPRGECGAAGRYVVEVHDDGLSRRTTAAPLDLTLVLEPAVPNRSGLPAPVDSVAEASPRTGGTPVASVGAESLEAAPVIGTGVYSDVLRPGDELYWRVPVEWGRRLAYRLTMPDLSEADRELLGTGGWVSTTVRNPVGSLVSSPDAASEGHYDGETAAFGGFTAPVRYLNRESATPEVAAASLAGHHHVGVRWEPDTAAPGLAVTVVLEVEVLGEQSGAPRYRETETGTPAEQLAVWPASDGSPPAKAGFDRSLLWAGLVGGAALAVAGGVTGMRLLRRDDI